MVAVSGSEWYKLKSSVSYRVAPSLSLSPSCTLVVELIATRHTESINGGNKLSNKLGRMYEHPRFCSVISSTTILVELTHHLPPPSGSRLGKTWSSHRRLNPDRRFALCKIHFIHLGSDPRPEWRTHQRRGSVRPACRRRAVSP